MQCVSVDGKQASDATRENNHNFAGRSSKIASMRQTGESSAVKSLTVKLCLVGAMGARERGKQLSLWMTNSPTCQCSLK